VRGELPANLFHVYSFGIIKCKFQSKFFFIIVNRKIQSDNEADYWHISFNIDENQNPSSSENENVSKQITKQRLGPITSSLIPR
jgi:hypothetical protein